MRKILAISLVFLSLAGCSKKQQKTVINDGIIGKWKAIEHFTSPGYGGTWSALPISEQFIITFKNDGTFSYSANFPKENLEFDTFTLSGTQINVFRDGGLSSYAENWYIRIVDNRVMNLQIYPCIEGCPYKLIPVD